jgi:nicotinate-nucleotide adenylyltransferase
MRLGLLGGTFDPVHYGHLLMAETAREQCRLDQVLFIPAAVPPHKQSWQVSDAAQRIEMLELAVGGNDQFAVSRIEIDRGGVSFSVDTLSELHQQQPERELFLILGADSLVDLPSWREPARIAELATIAVCGRPGFEPDLAALSGHLPAESIEAIRKHRVEMPLIGVSSREMRRRVAVGLSIRYQTPRAVEKYIESQGLYRTSGSADSAPDHPHGQCAKHSS